MEDNPHGEDEDNMGPYIEQRVYSSYSRKNPCTVDMLCLPSATCSYNLPKDAQNLKRPEFLFHIDLFDPLFCTYQNISIHDSSDSREVVFGASEASGHSEPPPTKCTMKDEMVSGHMKQFSVGFHFPSYPLWLAQFAFFLLHTY